ncbi:MAG: Proline iminopeptidase [Candidatus Saccharibacteria bacterium]|nr:Proline iminopeptidase [Candidatus Saccharibacteria bacterium]
MEQTDIYVRDKGFLDVGDGHKIYWEDWGNPDATPVMHFHGGPGGGFSDGHKIMFNPDKQRIIFFDQRGSGRSTPYAETIDNTTQKLIEDTEKLREHLGIEKMHLVGGSWGSTMVLTYAIAHPDRVLSMVMWGIYMGRQFENDLISAGHARYNYPEAWERFIALVPAEYRQNGTSITQYYADKINSDDDAEAHKYANEWALWESSLLSLSYDQRKLEQSVLSDISNLPLARLETHYFLNGCFLPENYILDNVDAIKHIPCYVVQGRFDNCTPPISAVELSKAYGDNMTLQMVNAGHRRSDPELLAALRAAVNIMF